MPAALELVRGSRATRLAATRLGLNSMTRVHATLLAALLMFSLPAAVAHADRRYFLLTYTPYLEPAGESEVEWWLTSKVGKQDPAEGATWESRAELEHALTSRLTGAVYLNFQRPPGGPLKWASSSGSRNLVDFESVQVSAVVVIEL
jgi:hypothetical protein